MEPSYIITKAKPEHLTALANIELAADTLFDGYVPPSIPEVSTPQHKFHSAQLEGRLWIALLGEPLLASPWLKF
jgi:hypothetical protein